MNNFKRTLEETLLIELSINTRTLENANLVLAVNKNVKLNKEFKNKLIGYIGDLGHEKGITLKIKKYNEFDYTWKDLYIIIRNTPVIFHVYNDTVKKFGQMDKTGNKATGLNYSERFELFDKDIERGVQLLLINW